MDAPIMGIFVTLSNSLEIHHKVMSAEVADFL